VSALSHIKLPHSCIEVEHRDEYEMGSILGIYVDTQMNPLE